MVEKFRERFILTELHEDERNTKIAFVVIGILILILIGVVLYFISLSVKNQKFLDANKRPVVTPAVSSSPTVQPTSVPAVSSSPTPTPATSGPAIKEYFIPLGAGTNQAGDWTDVPGVVASIDFGNYQSIKEIRFEASVNVPTANETVSIRLFNKTDSHPVWYSEVTTVSDVYAVLQPLTYDTGTKIYQVQMKTQLQFPANLTQARIHIILR